MLDYRVHRRLTELADQGDPAYQRLLAEYLFDKGDFDSAFQWEVKSAEAGDPIAQNFMGYYFSYGINAHLKPTAPDYARALEWYKKAAAQDFQPSQEELCEMYSRGLGVSPDQETAYFWCSLSGFGERATKFKRLSADALDHETQQRVEHQVKEWIDSRRANR
jgi:TPR repeat protein